MIWQFSARYSVNSMPTKSSISLIFSPLSKCCVITTITVVYIFLNISFCVYQQSEPYGSSSCL